MSYSSIALLNDIVARQIAAGEVIDRPSAILRELLDNSIDSEASNIEVQIKNSGIDLVQVSDNGIGMTQADLALCCLPHATSKISTGEDLLRIRSMGFRGEALPSIASVSRVSIYSKHKDEPHAWKIEAHNTQISKPIQSSRSTGTTVKAERLFQDIPARRKFLSSAKAELTHLKTMLLAKVAPFPSIACALISDSLVLIKIPKETALARSIRICSANSVIQDFVWIEQQLNVAKDSIASDITDSSPRANFREYTLHAALGLPETAQKSRRHIHIYINNRPVKEFAILQAVEYAYRNVLHGAKYPQAVVFLQIPPEELDINIHPAKTEVKIKHIEPIRRLLISSIEQRLLNLAQSTPKIINPESSYQPLFLATPQYNEANTDTQQALQTNYPSSSYASSRNSSAVSSAPPSPDSSIDPFVPLTNATTLSTLAKKASVSYARPTATTTRKPQKEPNTPLDKSSKNMHTTNTVLQSLNPKSNGKDNTTFAHTPQEYSNLTTSTQNWSYIGMVFTTYLLFEQNTTSLHTHNKSLVLLLLDFHAAHEKILYDALIANSKAMPLLAPLPLSLDLPRADITKIMVQYAKIGIGIEEVENNHFALTTVPEQCPLEIDVIAKLVETLPLEDQLHNELFARSACRAAAKAGDHVDMTGAYDLLDKVLALKVPRCPHGRPLWLTLDKHSLDKLIGRID